MWLRVYSLFGMMDIYGAYDRCGRPPSTVRAVAGIAPACGLGVEHLIYNGVNVACRR